MELTISHLSKRHQGNVMALRDLSLGIEPGVLAGLKERCLISSTIRHEDGVEVRAMADEPPAAAARQVAPRLEDAYLYCVSRRGKGGTP